MANSPPECFILQDSYCGSEFNGYPAQVVAPITDVGKFNEFITHMIDVNYIAPTFQSGFNCTGPQLLDDLAKLRYPVTYECRKIVKRAIAAGCQFDNSTLSAEGPMMCLDECNAAGNSLATVFGNEQSCPGNPNQVRSGKLLEYVDTCSGLPTSNCIKSVPMEICGFGTRNSALVGCVGSEDQCCVALLQESASATAEATSSTSATTPSASPSEKQTRAESDNSPDLGVILAGIVVVLAVLILAIIFVVRRKRQQQRKVAELEEKYEPRVDTPPRGHMYGPRDAVPLNSSAPSYKSDVSDRQSSTFAEHIQNQNVPITSNLSGGMGYTEYPVDQSHSSPVQQQSFAAPPPQVFAMDSKSSKKPSSPESVEIPEEVLNESPSSVVEQPVEPIDSQVMVVVHPFYPSLADELRLEVGMELLLLKPFDDGWALGMNTKTGQQGAFPLVCVTKQSEYAAFKTRSKGPDEPPLSAADTEIHQSTASNRSSHNNDGSIFSQDEEEIEELNDIKKPFSPIKTPPPDEFRTFSKRVSSQLYSADMVKIIASDQVENKKQQQLQIEEPETEDATENAITTSSSSGSPQEKPELKLPPAPSKSPTVSQYFSEYYIPDDDVPDVPTISKEEIH